LRCDSNVCDEAKFGDTYKHLCIILTEAQRRYDRTSTEGAKRPLQEGALLTKVGVEQVDKNIYMVDDSNAEGERLVGPRKFGIGDVDIMDEYVTAVLGCDKWLTERVNVIELVAETCGVIKIGQFCWSEFLRLIIENSDRFAGRAKQDLFATHHQVVFWVRSVQWVLSRCATEFTATRYRVFQYFWNRIANAGRLQNMQRRIVDALDIPIAERLVVTA